MSLSIHYEFLSLSFEIDDISTVTSEISSKQLLMESVLVFKCSIASLVADLTELLAFSHSSDLQVIRYNGNISIEATNIWCQAFLVALIHIKRAMLMFELKPSSTVGTSLQIPNDGRLMKNFQLKVGKYRNFHEIHNVCHFLF